MTARHGRRALLEMLSAYRHFVNVDQDSMPEAQQEHMKQAEYCISRAIMHLPRDMVERRALREFVEKMMRRELAEFPCV